ncbi:MAG: hypothetical protein EXS37_03475 [Opitutus sp.]|nr:hypothetical protein [Opitutus sp.]
MHRNQRRRLIGHRQRDSVRAGAQPVTRSRRSDVRARYAAELGSRSRRIAGGREDSPRRRFLLRQPRPLAFRPRPPAVLDTSFREVLDGESYVVTVRVTGSPPFSFPSGYTYDSSTGSASITLNSPGTKSTRVANPLGASAALSFQVHSFPSIPVFTSQPSPVQSNTGRLFGLGFAVTGTKPYTYQWFKNGEPIESYDETYYKSQVTVAEAGIYHVTVRNSLGAATSVAVRVAVDETSRIQNFSARGTAGRSDSPLVIGFVTQGGDTKGLLIRGVGATLAAPPFNLAGTISDPFLEVYDARGLPVYTNESWTQVGNSAILSFATAASGAFPLRAFTDAADYLNIGSGAYTVLVSGRPNPGIALAEVYEADSTSGRLVNFSARGFVAPNASTLLPAIVIGGNAAAVPMRLLIRTLGPGLAAYGVINTLPDPVLTLVDSTGRTVATNDNWEQSANLAELRTATSRIAFPLAPGSKDAALLVIVPPGTYSCLVSDVGGTSGTALVEVYEGP